MKVFKFGFFLLITLTLTVFLDVKYKDIPPMGKLLNPFSGFWQNGEKEPITIDEIISNDNLSGEVNVVFDDLLIPHIYATSNQDTYFVQGYITAFHRLWQMDMTARSTAGRIAEISGSSGAIKFDRTQRRKGLTFAAERLLEEVKKDPEVYEMLQAYSEGINAYINSLSYKDLPIEYKLTNTYPEPWSPLKSCLVMRSMANLLSTGETDLENTNFVKLFGKEFFDTLYPDYFPNVDPIIPNGTPYDFEPIAVGAPDTTDYPDLTIAQTIDKPDPDNGSNSFVVGPGKTSNGNVILSNELDLPLSLPSIWYLAHLSSPDLNVMGSTIPGMPGVIVGFNDSIAWGNTNSPRDVVDWYLVEFKNSQRTEYLYDGKWMKAHQRIEEIQVADGETFYDTVIYTHHGPVTYDRNFLGDGEQVNFAMRWISHDPNLEYRTVIDINKANNYEDFVSSFQPYGGPAQNYSFASRKKDYALWVHGQYPVKWEEQGKFLMDGRKRDHEWQEFIPREQNMHILNDPRGWVSSANQHPADSTYPYYIYHHRYQYYRNRRLNDRLVVMNNVTVEDVMQLQNDNFNYIASENLPVMLDSLDTVSISQTARQYYDLLKGWDYFSDPEREAPTIFELWQNKLLDNLWDEFDTASISLSRPGIYNSFYLLKNNPEIAFVDMISTNEKESVRDLYNVSFVQAVDSIEQWKQVTGKTIEWYVFKSTKVSHMAGIDAFSVDGVKIGGNRNIVNAASESHGPSWRMVVELGNEIRAWGVYPGSQTGNPGNPMWAHWVEAWGNGVYSELYFGSKENLPADKTIATVKFEK